MSFGQDDKRRMRQIKRTLKRAGNKKVRKDIKDLLRENPEEASAKDEPDYGELETRRMNGMDKGKQDFGEK
jgi:hypothetical protein